MTDRSHTDYGTDANPVHASALPSLVKCAWRSLMTFFDVPAWESGEAADTGTATHVAVQEWHKSQDAAAAVDAMREGVSNYAKANLGEAAEIFLNYAADPRNREAKVVANELKIRFEIAPTSYDPTQAPITIVGRLDQVREEYGQLKVFDLKTSKEPPMKLMQLHMLQVAAYCVGATYHFGRPVLPGALICARQYARRAPVFFEYAFDLSHTAALFDAVRHSVAQIRMGSPSLNPGEHCRWCIAGSTDNCVPRYTTFQTSLQTLAATR